MHKEMKLYQLMIKNATLTFLFFYFFLNDINAQFDQWMLNENHKMMIEVENDRDSLL